MVADIPRSRRGITLIELLVVLAVVAILAAAAIPRLERARTRALGVALATDLRNLEFLQEQYRSNGHPSYTDDVAELGYVPSAGVHLTITLASAEGWAAVATHLNDPEVRCAVFQGLGALPSGLFPAQRTGAIECARGQRRFGIPASVPTGNPGIVR